MKVTPYRVRFEVDAQGSGHYHYGIPSEDIIPMELEGNEGYYVLHTHDRGEHQGTGPYYQVAFRIVDPSPYAIEDLTLSIDNQSFRKGTQVVDNDLVFDEDRNLWYQKSRYALDKKNSRWSIVSDNKKNALPVDCITTAGVFKVIVLHKGVPLVGYTQPWIYVLPSSISKEEYSTMLDDLIRLHERLVLRDKSTVGIGSVQEMETGNSSISSEIKNLDRFLQLLKTIIKFPSERQSKRYTKADIHRTKHYDTRVIRDYLRSGGTGKVSAVEYYSDHDTYEHRVIKRFIQLYLQKHAVRRTINAPKYSDIESLVDEQYAQLFNTQHAQINTVNKMCFQATPPLGGYRLCIVVNGNIIATQSHHPFSTTKPPYVSYVGVSFIAHSKRELVWYLDCLAQSVKKCNSSRDNKLELKYRQCRCTPIKGGIQHYTFENVLSFNRRKHPNDNAPDISDTIYHKNLIELREKYPFIKLDDTTFSFETNQSTKSDANEQAMKADLRARLKEEYVQYDTLNRYYEKLDELSAILDSEWFQEVNDTDLRHFAYIEPTAKFLYNPYYSEIFRLINDFIKKQPLLASDFDINGFGVISTQLVYEYWVFYKLLDYFDHCGFSISSKNISLKEHFKEFIESVGTARKLSGIVMSIERNIGETPINIELGYDRIFESSSMQRRPDFYLKIKNTHDDTNHWYFMDAKYKTFTKGQRSSKAGSNAKAVDYIQEIQDVAIQKYITDMLSILHEDGLNNKIMGSYIVMAGMEKGNDHEISVNGRLFGAQERIGNDQSMPCHRYGAIWLSADDDSELSTLMSLIFEYLEAGKSNESPLLNICWRCGTDITAYREKKTTYGGGIKYYVTCPTCSSFRVDTFCLEKSCQNSIIKHTNHNYHQRSYSDAGTGSNNQWGFYCPECGKGL